MQHDDPPTDKSAKEHAGNTFDPFEPQFEETTPKRLGMRLSKIRPEGHHSPGQDDVSCRQRVRKSKDLFLNLFTVISDRIIHCP